MEKKYNDPSVNINVFLCAFSYEVDKGILGRGTFGGACSSDPVHHGVIMGFDHSDIYVGRVIFWHLPFCLVSLL